MAVVGFHIYISIVLCLTAKARSDLTTTVALSELNNMIENLNENVALINMRIYNLEILNEEKYKDFHKKIIEQMNVMNSKIEASHDKLERIRAENLVNLNSWTTSQENRLNRIEYAINNATIDRETRFTELQQTIDQVSTNASTKIESVEMNIYESLPSRTEEIWASIGICPIPFDIDRRISVKYELSSSSQVDVREGDTIRNQDYAIFNCSNVIEQKYEPANRRFQCVRGQWMEAERSPDWKLGNNGSFPECREAKCDPPCKNGGVCFRDGECKCAHMTTGAICETFLCDKNCAKNGGQCVSPGRCGNCPISRRGDNCEIKGVNNTCAFPDVPRNSELTKRVDRHPVFQEGDIVKFQCKDGFYIRGSKIRKCINGKWTKVRFTCNGIAPGLPPRNVRAWPHSLRTIFIDWEEPVIQNTVIQAYKVIYTTQPELPIHLWQSQEVTGDSTMATISGLIPYRTYTICVLASNDFGKGPLSVPVKVLTSHLE